MGAHYRSTSALSVTGDVCRSYSEPIGCFDYRNAPGTVLVSDACAAHHGTPFSTTTSKHIGQLVRALEARDVPYRIVDHDQLRGIAAGR